jgi:hypothetical protein
MTTPIEPAADPEQALNEQIRRIVEETRAAQGPSMEVTDPGCLHRIARLILDARND